MSRTARICAVALLVVALGGCTGDEGTPDPGPSTGGQQSGSSTASSGPVEPEWNVQPVWQGTVWFRQAADLPVTMRLYPLQRIDGRVLLTVDYTPQGTADAEMALFGPFCIKQSCLTMESVSLIDPVALVRYGPLLQGEEGSPRNDEFAASLDRRSSKAASVTYRYGAFFPDPGTSSVSVDLVHAGAITGVPITGDGSVAPGLVVPGAPTVTATPSPVPSVQTSIGDGSTLITFPVASPPADAGEQVHPLVARVLGGEVTDYTGTVNLNADVLFAFNAATLTAKAKNLIDQAVAVLADKADPSKPLLVTGHTDNVGGPAYNDRLSTQRAQAVAAALKANPTSASWSLTVTGRGEKDPAVPNTMPGGADDPAGRALNRRVEIAYTPKLEPTPTPTATTGTAGTSGTDSGTQPSATLAFPSPAATVGPVALESSGGGGGTVTATVDPVVITGGLALIRLLITPQEEFIHTDGFSRMRASGDSGRIQLVDPSTKTTYLAAHDSGDEDRVLGTDGVHTMKPGRTYTYFVYTAAPPDATRITVDLGQLGTVAVPVQR